MIDKNYIKLMEKRVLSITIPQRVIGAEYKLLDFYRTQYANKNNGERSTYYTIEYRKLTSGENGCRFISSFERKSFFNLLSDAEKIKIAFVKKVEMKTK